LSRIPYSGYTKRFYFLNGHIQVNILHNTGDSQLLELLHRTLKKVQVEKNDSPPKGTRNLFDLQGGIRDSTVTSNDYDGVDLYTFH